MHEIFTFVENLEPLTGTSKLQHLSDQNTTNNFFRKTLITT